MIRRAAVAGTWYPGSASALEAAVERYVAEADEETAANEETAADAPPVLDEILAIIAPHAGLMYSGPVAAHAYRLLRARAIEVAVIVGPSHHVAFDGVSVYDGEAFETPLGLVRVDRACVDALKRASPLIHVLPAAHVREHSLEMQLPFLRQLVPGVRIVPLVMGHQTPATVRAIGDALGDVLGDAPGDALAGRKMLLVASSDLSHYHDAATAARLDKVVIDHVARFDEEGLQRVLTARPDHACGGGPTVAVMRAARRLGARDAVVLKYADSGDISGDKSAVVGYLAAALGTTARPAL